MEYKRHYTDEELKELMDWFDSHWDILPESIYMDKATYIKDFKHTLRLHYDIINQLKDNPTYSAQIYQVFKMRDVAAKELKEKGQI